jgi:hypothetical protein
MKTVLLITDVLTHKNDNNKITYSVGCVQTIYSMSTINSTYFTFYNDESIESLVNKIGSSPIAPHNEVEIHFLHPTYFDKLMAVMFEEQGYTVRLLNNVQINCRKPNDKDDGVSRGKELILRSGYGINNYFNSIYHDSSIQYYCFHRSPSESSIYRMGFNGFCCTCDLWNYTSNL